MLVARPSPAVSLVATTMALVAPSVLCATPARADDAKRACVAASTAGQTLRDDDKLLEARDRLHACADEACPDLVRAHCTRWLDELEAQIPSIIVRVKDTDGRDIFDAEVTIDGHPVKLGRAEALDPGEHVVSVARAGEGELHAEERLLLVDGERARVVAVQLPPLPSPAPPAAAPLEPPAAENTAHESARPVPTGAWVLGGVGLVGLGSFAYFFAQATSDLDTLKRTCAPACTDADTSPARLRATIADVSLGVGLAALAGGVTWAILGRSAGSSRVASSPPLLDVGPVPGGAMTSVSLRF